MKKIYIPIVITTILICMSCGKDFLDRPPFDKKSIGNFYKTPQDGLEALVAVYDALQGSDIVGDNDYDNIIIISEIASDNCYAGGGATDDFRLRVWDEFQKVYANPHELQWQKYYRGLYRANVFLENVDKIDWGNKSNLKNIYIAETRFLRAYFYFDLIRIFGHIPLLKGVADINDLYIPQADPAEVYKFIAEDLKFAIENLENKPYQSISSSDYGRVTKWAAEALTGRVFLFYTGYYNKPDLEGIVSKSEVKGYIDDVINNSGHALVDDFENLWPYSSEKYVGEDNIETVFAIKYTYKALGDAAKRDGNRWQVMIGLRNQVIPPYGNGWGCCTVTPQLWNAYSTDDTRRDGTILWWDPTWKYQSRYNLFVTAADYIDTKDKDKDGLTTDTMNVGGFDPIDQREFTGYNGRKFVTLAAPDKKLIVQNLGGNFMRDNYIDYPVIRFSDVLLMGAELNLDGNIGLAQSYFDKVRTRAFKDKFNEHVVILTNDAAGRKSILEERRCEFALEGHRYWDLLRQDGIAGNFSVAKSAIDCEKPYPVVFRPETQGVFEIPQPQIDLSNGTLKQNPGWE